MKAKKLFVFGAFMLALSSLVSSCDGYSPDIEDVYVYDLVPEGASILELTTIQDRGVVIGRNYFLGTTYENERQATKLFDRGLRIIDEAGWDFNWNGTGITVTYFVRGPRKFYLEEKIVF